MSFLGNAAEFLGAWVSCPPSRLGWGEKIRYLTRLAALPLNRKKSIPYLGREFHFDNIRTPVLLLRYPKDITVHLLPYLTAPVRSVLDIGGNLGQFSLALARFEPQLEQIDIFEPNPAIRNALERNITAQMRTFPYGVGEPGPREFYSPASASVGGSLIAERARWKGQAPVCHQVEVVADIASITGRGEYDLVKIDVEGAEWEVLRHLQVTTRYLWLELSGRNKAGSAYQTSQLYQTLQQRFGDFQVLYHSQWDADSVCDVLLEFH